MRWCKKCCTGVKKFGELDNLGLDLTEETFSAISDSLDVDLAMENVEFCNKTVFKSVNTLEADEGGKKYYRKKYSGWEEN